MPFGAVDPYDRDTVVAMVRDIRPGWDLLRIAPIAQGTDALYRIDVDTGSGERAVVLKIADFVDRERFVREPRTLSLVGERTDIPVPTVVGVREAHEDLPAPYFLLDAVGGVDANDEGVLADSDRLERLAVDSGRSLATLHDAWDGDLSGFGWIEPGDDGFAVVDPTADWSETFRQTAIDSAIDHFGDGRFADLAPSLRDRVDALAATLPDAEPVICHNDWRPGNLRIDPDSGTLVAALDWGVVSAGHDLAELAAVEEFLSDRPPLDDQRRDRVRKALRQGYTDRRALPAGDAADRSYLAALLASRLTAMRWFDEWNDGASEAELERRARGHREFVARALDRLGE